MYMKQQGKKKKYGDDRPAPCCALGLGLSCSAQGGDKPSRDFAALRGQRRDAPGMLGKALLLPKPSPPSSSCCLKGPIIPKNLF